MLFNFKLGLNEQHEKIMKKKNFLIIGDTHDYQKAEAGTGSKMVKAASITGIIPIIFVSHYTDSPFIAIYVLAGLAVVIWCVVLVLFLKRRKALKNLPEVEEVKEEVAPLTPIQEASSNDDEEEVVTVTDEKGNTFQIRYIKSFKAKLCQANDELKDCYNELKNYALSYKKANSRISWNFDTINCGRDQILKFSIRGKTLCLYFAFNPEEVDEKYKVEKLEAKKYADTPCLYRIKNDRRREYAKELIDMAMKKFDNEKGKESHEDFSLPYEDTASLVNKGLIREFKSKASTKAKNEHHESISVLEADERMSDEEAASNISDDLSGKKHKGKKGIINIDTINDNFSDGDTVDIEALWEKKLVPTSIGYIKVLARGKINKRLNLDLQDYSLEAVKMVLLAGGTVKRAR